MITMIIAAPALLFPEDEGSTYILVMLQDTSTAGVLIWSFVLLPPALFEFQEEGVGVGVGSSMAAVKK